MYSNFVKPSNSSDNRKIYCSTQLSGFEAKKLYLEEIKIKSDYSTTLSSPITLQKQCEESKKEIPLSDKELFFTVQNNDVNKLIEFLDNYPEKLNIVDNYGWSLLMIACQANSVETVKELLHRGIDPSIRDKAGNSATSLVIKSRNLELVDLLLNEKYHKGRDKKLKESIKRRKEEFKCEICDNNVFSDKNEHLSSTVHNINASKGKKIPTNYVIPPSNKGYQIMLKAGWDKDCGLGPDGSGKRYPIRTVQKQNRKGLGSEKKKVNEHKKATIEHQHKNILNMQYHKNKQMEINFRRQFY